MITIAPLTKNRINRSCLAVFAFGTPPITQDSCGDRRSPADNFLQITAKTAGIREFFGGYGLDITGGAITRLGYREGR
jgi:hypothetical protein